MELVEGVYENLINKDLERDIQHAEGKGLVCKSDIIDTAESSHLMANYLADIIRKKLEDDNLSTEERMKFINRILVDAQTDTNDLLVPSDNKLTAVLSREEDTRLKVTKQKVITPLSGFRVSNLFTGGQSILSLDEEIQRDISSADQICFIVSFLKLSGIRLIIDNLRKFCNKEGHSLRIITTTYCGITDGKAVEQLSQLPNTEIKISYNTKIERLHAKSYIFIRNSGLSTAYIGSSNLSRSAQTDGLEWNIRVTNVENPHIIKSAMAAFNMYWDSKNFEDFRDGGIEKFNKEINKQNQPKIVGVYQRYSILPHQKEILDKLKVERDENNLFCNLIVAATGTGKTVISAFDYQQFKRENPKNNKLLFVAHREEILRQSLNTFRGVLQDYNFGELWVGDHKPQNGIDYLFVSVQTLNSKIETFKNLSREYYDYIVIDEAHHITADSYWQIVNYFKPKILLGLTATPERMDGKSLLPYFGDTISAEIRLPKALEAGLLTPFQYLCITDPTDLSSDDLWQGSKYITSKLSDMLCRPERAALVVQKLRQYISDETKCKALCFCTDKKHAAFMAQALSDCGLKAAYLTSDNDKEREQLNKDLAAGNINYLCVVDMFNEGVDIPEVDTVLFLRPTDSLTIFLQQLGRGLRLSAGKQYLTVLDFVAQVNNKYDFASRFRSLCTRQDRDVKAQIREGFTLLPHGCSIYMEEKAQKVILENITSAIYNISRLQKELSGYSECPTLNQFLANNGQDIRLVYRNNNCWSKLKKLAGKCDYNEDEYTLLFEKGMVNLVHINSTSYLKFLGRFVEAKGKITPANRSEEIFSLMLYYALFQNKCSKLGFGSIYEALQLLGNYPEFLKEIGEIKYYLLSNLNTKAFSIGEGYPEALEQYGCYTREEIFMIMGRQTAEKKMQGSVTGVFNVEELNTEIFFVTLNKSDKDFSPQTQYDDYVMSETKFHWQSQNTDSHSDRGKRFVEQAKNKKRFLLFVRENKKDGFGNTSPFYCFGLVDYIRSYGNCPMSIEWRLQEPVMPQFMKAI